LSLIFCVNDAILS